MTNGANLELDSLYGQLSELTINKNDENLVVRHIVRMQIADILGDNYHMVGLELPEVIEIELKLLQDQLKHLQKDRHHTTLVERVELCSKIGNIHRMERFRNTQSQRKSFLSKSLAA